MKKCVLALFAGIVGLGLQAFEYNVRQPSDVLRPKWHAADTAPGVWTLNVADAKAKAAAAGACTILLNTASWWCPFCETLEDMVLRSKAWSNYVEEKGYYLAMLDFPYRGDVTEDQKWKSWHPELGRGWGFKCWLMCPDYLADIGLTEAQGLEAIMAEYELQKELAAPEATVEVIGNWTGKETFSYGKVGYPTLIVFGPDGAELGRTSFPWNRAEDVTESEAQEYVIQAIERIVNGMCMVCKDPLDGTPDVSASQMYRGWLEDEEGGIAGLIEVKTGRKNARGHVTVSGSATSGGKNVAFNSIQVGNAACESCLVCGDNPDEWQFGNFTLAKRGTPYVANLALGSDGLTGTYADGVHTYKVIGGRDIFHAKDATALRKAEECPRGIWSIVMKSAEKVAPSPFARGYGTLTMELGLKGRVTVKGALGDGTKVSIGTTAIVGDDGLVCVPVLANLYSHKGGFGFVTWFRNGKLLGFTGVAPWKSTKDGGFVSAYTVSSTMSAGMGNVPAELELTLLDFDSSTVLGNLPLADEPMGDLVEVDGLKWKGTEATEFKASVNGRTGSLKGKMMFHVRKPDGKIRRVSGLVRGVVMGGAGYGSIVLNNTGSWAVRIAVCGSCSE